MPNEVTNTEITKAKQFLLDYLQDAFGSESMNICNNISCSAYTFDPVKNIAAEALFNAGNKVSVNRGWTEAIRDGKTVYFYAKDATSPTVINFHGFDTPPTISEKTLLEMDRPPERSTLRVILDAICHFFTGHNTAVGQAIEDKLLTYKKFEMRETLRNLEISILKENAIEDRNTKFMSSLSNKNTNTKEINNRIERLFSIESTATQKDIPLSENIVNHKLTLPASVSNQQFIGLVSAAAIRVENLTNIKASTSSIFLTEAAKNDKLKFEYTTNRMYLTNNVLASGYDERLKGLSEGIIRARTQAHGAAVELSKGNTSPAATILHDGITEYLKCWNDITVKSNAAALALSKSLEKQIDTLNSNPELKKATNIDPEILKKCNSIISFSKLVENSTELESKLYNNPSPTSEQLNLSLKRILSSKIIIASVIAETANDNDRLKRVADIASAPAFSAKHQAIMSDNSLNEEQKLIQATELEAETNAVKSEIVRQQREVRELPPALIDYVANPKEVLNHLESQIESSASFKRYVTMDIKQLMNSMVVDNQINTNSIYDAVKKDILNQNREKKAAEAKKVKDEKKVKRAHTRGFK